MSESELLKRISELEVQNLALIAENERLRKEFGLPLKNIVAQQSIIEPVCSLDKKENNETQSNECLINKFSPPDEKIEMFLSLFRGRTDIYAKRCYSKKHESSYYIPACKNEWVRGVCDRTRKKCKDCPNRDLLQLTKTVIDSHLRNKDENGAGIVGIYPLLQDETCLFLAIDFDEEKWQIVSNGLQHFQIHSSTKRKRCECPRMVFRELFIH